MAKRTRSALYHNAAVMTDKFKEHLSIIWSFTDRQQNALLVNLPELLTVVTARERMLLEEKTTKAIGGDAQKALQSINVIQMMASMWDPSSDTTDLAMKDIYVLHVLPEESEQKVRALNFLHRLFEILEKDNDRRLRNRTAGSILPYMKNCDTAVDLRRIIKSNFDWNDQSPDEYKPDIIGTVPLALIKIKLSEGDPVVFQCEVNEMEMLIRKLQATLREMK